MQSKLQIQAMSKDEAVAYAKNPANRTIVAIPVLLIVSFIFYVLSGFFSYAAAATDKSSDIIAGVSDSIAADSFNKIQMAMRIMPSHKTEGNMLIMVPGEGSAEWQGEYDSEFDSNISSQYYTTDNMEDYFPDMLFTENTVPLGNAKPFCLHLDWSTKANKKILDKYYSVQDMPTCNLAANPKFRWQETDPKDGLDFSLWRQHSKKATYADDCESNAIFVKSKATSGGVCYRYDVIESVCIAVTFKIDEETATYGWSYEGGCFEDGRIVNYMEARPGTDYNFDKLDFEVREYIPDSATSWFTLSGFFGFLAFLCIIGAFVAAGVLIYQFYKNKQANQGGVAHAASGNVQMSGAGHKEKHQAFTDEQ